MIKIYKKKCKEIQYKENIAELYICNFNGKITYKYIDKYNSEIRGKSCSNIISAINSIIMCYNKYI